MTVKEESFLDMLVYHFRKSVVTLLSCVLVVMVLELVIIFILALIYIYIETTGALPASYPVGIRDSFPWR
jgi:hypothetical protein